MKIKCPNCLNQNKIKSFAQLEFKEHYLCKNCGKHLYLENPVPWIIKILIEFFIYIVGSFLLPLIFFFLVARLPESLGVETRVLIGIVIFFIVFYLIDKVFLYFQSHIFKIKAEDS